MQHFKLAMPRDEADALIENLGRAIKHAMDAGDMNATAHTSWLQGQLASQMEPPPTKLG